MERNSVELTFRRRLRQSWLPVLVLIVTGWLILLVLMPQASQAKTSFLAAARSQYPAIMLTRLDSCYLCHSQAAWFTLNSYGQVYSATRSFTAIADLDSDGDTYSNSTEIAARTFPGDPNDYPGVIAYNQRVYLPVLFKAPAPTSNGQYVVIAWNDLGMHCMDPSYEDFAVLPPFNTLWAQVVKRGLHPQVVTSEVAVEYRIIDNTYSVIKTNFWDYAHILFKPLNPLPNVGLAGYGLAGEMHPASDHFAAEGIPLTEYRDNLNLAYPYQMAEVTVKDGSGQVLARTQTVTPVSTEMNCQNCHSDNGKGNKGIATGSIKQNILTLHDDKEGTDLMNKRPVLCAECHGSNALGKPGNPALPNLSRAMHGQHQSQDTFTMYGTCYQCHPGSKTKCLRDVMYYEAGKTCQDCHGNMSDVANPARNPWLTEPRCATCHGAANGENSGKLYRFSTGHGGLYCQACHGSQHAIYPTGEANDNVQSRLLQGHSGTLEKCTICHTSVPTGQGPHGGD